MGREAEGRGAGGFTEMGRLSQGRLQGRSWPSPAASQGLKMAFPYTWGYNGPGRCREGTEMPRDPIGVSEGAKPARGGRGGGAKAVPPRLLHGPGTRGRLPEAENLDGGISDEPGCCGGVMPASGMAALPLHHRSPQNASLSAHGAVVQVRGRAQEGLREAGLLGLQGTADPLWLFFFLLGSTK